MRLFYCEKPPFYSTGTGEDLSEALLPIPIPKSAAISDASIRTSGTQLRIKFVVILSNPTDWIRISANELESLEYTIETPDIEAVEATSEFDKISLRVKEKSVIFTWDTPDWTKISAQIESLGITPEDLEAIHPLTIDLPDFENLKIQYEEPSGEQVLFLEPFDRSGAPEPDGLFCESIFGTLPKTENLDELKQIVFKSGPRGEKLFDPSDLFVRTGTLKFPIEIPHPALSGKKINTICVLPSGYRLGPPNSIEDQIQDATLALLGRSIRLDRLMKLGPPELLVQTESKFLSESVEKLFQLLIQEASRESWAGLNFADKAVAQEKKALQGPLSGHCHREIRLLEGLGIQIKPILFV